MAAIIHPLLTLLASLTRQDLARQVAYLKAENRILRSKLPERITLSNQERRTLVRHGKKLGARIKELISIVSYATFRRWVRQLQEAPSKRPTNEDAKSGRPRVEEGVIYSALPRTVTTIGEATVLVITCRQSGAVLLNRRST